MAISDNDTYPFTFEAVRDKAPNASGVYRLHTPQQWVYIGESDDIRQSLFRHLNEPSESMTRFGPLSFSMELAPAAERHALQQCLIAELEPSVLAPLATTRADGTNQPVARVDLLPHDRTGASALSA